MDDLDIYAGPATSSLAPLAAPVATRTRHDGWTIVRQAKFLRVLAAKRSVSLAARAVGMSRESAYRLRRRDPSGLFAAMWDLAIAPTRGPASCRQVDEGHKLAIARAAFPLAPHAPARPAPRSTS